MHPLKRTSIIFLAVLFISIGIIDTGMALLRMQSHLSKSNLPSPTTIANIYSANSKLAPEIVSPVKPATISAIQTKNLSLAQRDSLYGPCVSLPVLMYHHIRDLGQARLQGHAQLTVDPKYFKAQMQYFHDHEYTVIPMTALVNFFDNGTPLPKKPLLLTFDDGYDDFGTNAVPILNSFGYPATLFVPTGLIQNPGYLTWSSITSIAHSQPVLMSNHTWSHHNMGGGNKSVIEQEITTADTQLARYGLNEPKVFAYPYGTTSTYAISFLQKMKYELAFTTQYGTFECKQQRLVLPRVRMGNAVPSYYGL